MAEDDVITGWSGHDHDESDCDEAEDGSTAGAAAGDVDGDALDEEENGSCGGSDSGSDSSQVTCSISFRVHSAWQRSVLAVSHNKSSSGHSG